MAEKILCILCLIGGTTLANMAATDIVYYAGYLPLAVYTSAVLCLTWGIYYGIKGKSSR